ncbi:MAG: 5/3-nucleotidase [Bradyrhizobium sp.]|nr:5/3-nucleotidase [Bradyrhizobium sp.]
MASGEPTRPLILVTNDDGIDSPGLRAAAEAAALVGDILIAAPITPQTGMGRSFPRGQTHGIIEILSRPLGDALHSYHAVHGSPAQAVAHAILEIAPRRPVLCISGINDGENLGGTNLISGTVGAAAEAAGFGIPAMAISIDSDHAERFLKPYDPADWKVPSGIIHRLARLMLQQALHPDLAFLNVNIPQEATLETEIRVTSQSRQNHYSCAAAGVRDLSRPFRLPVTAQIDFETLERESDLYAFVVDRVISVTPMGRDLTLRDTAGRPLDIGFPKPGATDRKMALAAKQALPHSMDISRHRSASSPSAVACRHEDSSDRN